MSSVLNSYNEAIAYKTQVYQLCLMAEDNLTIRKGKISVIAWDDIA
jgi:hypothetical protein